MKCSRCNGWEYISIIPRTEAANDAHIWYTEVPWLHQDHGETLQLHALYCLRIG